MPSKKKTAVVAEKVEEQTEKLRPAWKKWWWLPVVIVVLLGIGAGGYYYLQYQKAQSVDSLLAAQNEQKKLIERVGRLIALPQGEQPTIATVSDIEKLKGQPFFASAKNGDKVLIYNNAKKAILYDPIADKIVEVGPVEASQPTPSVSERPDSVRVAIYNGTTIVGLAAKLEEKLMSLSSIRVEVVSKGNARHRTYTKPLVIDLTGKYSEVATQLAGVLGGEVGSMPEGEFKPENVEIFVIAGEEAQ